MPLLAAGGRVSDGAATIKKLAQNLAILLPMGIAADCARPSDTLAAEKYFSRLRTRTLRGFSYRSLHTACGFHIEWNAGGVLFFSRCRVICSFQEVCHGNHYQSGGTVL